MWKRTTKERARGKWTTLLTEIVGPDAVGRKHGPCPMCGGVDRYRYDNKNGDGDWFCNQCGVGDGFALIQRALGMTFREAAKMVDRYLSAHSIEDDKPFKEVINIARRRENLNKLWASAKSPSVLIGYLRKRGIPQDTIVRACDLRGISAMTDWETGQTYPGMVALIRNKIGEPISLHRTFIGMDSGKQKKIMPPVETINGGYIRLGIPTDTLLIAEGIETALAGASMQDGLPAWAMISAHNMEVFDGVPAGVKRVIVCADHDLSYVGQAAAFKLASRLKNQRKASQVEVWMPTIPGSDMNDALVRGEGLYTWTGEAL